MCPRAGAMLLTVMPRGARSTTIVQVSIRMPPSAGQYGELVGTDRSSCTLEALIICPGPPCVTICFAVSWHRAWFRQVHSEDLASHLERRLEERHLALHPRVVHYHFEAAEFPGGAPDGGPYVRPDGYRLPRRPLSARQPCRPARDGPRSPRRPPRLPGRGRARWLPDTRGSPHDDRNSVLEPHFLPSVFPVRDPLAAGFAVGLRRFVEQ